MTSRRQFLKTSLQAAGAAGLGSFAVPALLTAGTSPNEKLSVAVVGVRGRGQSHGRAFGARPDCQISYVCDADRVIGENYAKTLGKKLGKAPRFVEDIRRICEDKSVDIVSVATPNHWHALAAIWAMQAGKDVYCEKPVSHNISEGRRLAQVARKYNRICQGGMQKRSLPANQEAAKYVAAGKFGKVRLAHTYMFRPRTPIGPSGSYPVPTSVNYDLWAGPAPMAPVSRREFHYDWHWFWNYGNGEIGNNSVHRVDTLRQILGLTGLGRGVLSYGGRVQFADAAETPNTHVVIHDFGPLTIVQEIRNLKTAPPPKSADVYLQSDQGTLVVTDAAVTHFDPKGAEVVKFTNARPVPKVTVQKGRVLDDFGNLDDRHIANFIKAVRSRKREDQIAEILEGHFSAALCHLGNISYRLGKKAAPGEIANRLEAGPEGTYAKENFEALRKHLADNGVDIAKEQLTLGASLKIDSDAERFVGSPAADALLTRDYRKPFVVPGVNEI